MGADKKIYLFEYMIKKIVEKYVTLKNVDKREALSAFSKLKLIKLNFFISAVNANEKNNGLLDIFDNFYAMPYGHVESDIYEGLKKLKYYSFEGNQLKENSQFPEDIKFPDEKRKIDQALESLYDKNPNILYASAFQLVELSHRWHSWKIMFEKAKSSGTNSTPISFQMIKFEPKYFELN